LIVTLEYDNGNHIETWEIPTKQYQRRLNTLLGEWFNQYQGFDDRIKKNALLFLNGEWYIPVQYQDEMYRGIVRLYSKVVK
jgi:hypothetical protein